MTSAHAQGRLGGSGDVGDKWPRAVHEDPVSAQRQHRLGVLTVNHALAWLDSKVTFRIAASAASGRVVVCLVSPTLRCAP